MITDVHRGAAPNGSGDSHDTTQWTRRTFWLALALALAPFAVSAVVAVAHGPGALIRDEALIEMRVRDVAQHPVLIGLYSRDGWSHPGPLLFYTLALPYRLFGSSPVGLLIGALLVNAAAVTGMALVARRIGGLPAALVTLIGATVVAHALGAEVVSDPWVCFITILPFGLFCFLVWAMTNGKVWALPVSVVVASWLTQTHVGYLPLTMPPLMLGAAWLWFTTRRAEPSRMKRLTGAVGAAVGLFVLLWLPTVWDQWGGSGNLGKVVKWFTQSDGQTYSVVDGFRIVFGQFAVVPDWITGTRRIGFNGETTLLNQTLWPVLLIPLVIAIAVAWRQGRRPILRLAAVTGFVVGAGVLSVASTIGIMYEYRLLWIWMLGMLGAVVIVWTTWNATAKRWPQSERQVLVPLAMVALVGLSVIQIVDVATSGSPDFYSATAGDVTHQLTAALEPRRGDVLLRSQSPNGELYLQGLVLGLERAGIAARVPSDPSQRFGAHRVANSTERIGDRLLVLADDDLVSAPPGLEVVAYSGPLPLDRYLIAARRAQAEERHLLRQLRTGTLTPAKYVARLAAVKLPGPTLTVLREP